MTKEAPHTHKTEDSTSTTKKFIKDHWPIIAGATTIFGAAVALTALLIKKRKSKQGIRIDHLEELSMEAISQTSNSHALLEEGQALAHTAGKEETSTTAKELADNTDDPTLAEALETFSYSSRI